MSATTFRLTINCDGAAIVDNRGELARLLTVAGDQYAAGSDSANLIDFNGNKVGHWVYGESKSMAALATLIDHAKETYPHFESERGQRDIAAASEALRAVRL